MNSPCTQFCLTAHSQSCRGPVSGSEWIINRSCASSALHTHTLNTYIHTMRSGYTQVCSAVSSDLCEYTSFSGHFSMKTSERGGCEEGQRKQDQTARLWTTKLFLTWIWIHAGLTRHTFSTVMQSLSAMYWKDVLVIIFTQSLPQLHIIQLGIHNTGDLLRHWRLL